MSHGLTDEQVKRQRLSVKRTRARKAGQFTPKLKSGRTTVYLKEICRAAIAGGCPLAMYCVNKEPSDKPQPVNVTPKSEG